MSIFMQIYDLHQRFRRYCAVEEGLSLQTIQGLKRSIITLTKRTGIETIGELSTSCLREFFYEGKEKHQWSYWHYVNNYKYLKKFLNWCVANEFIPNNPIFPIKKPKKPQSLPRRLTYTEAQQILCASFNYDWTYNFERSRNYAIIATFLFTGVRARELCGLFLADINLSSGVLLIRSGKGMKDRYVPIHHKLSYILKRYLTERKRLGKQSIYLFTGTSSNKPLSYIAVNRICRKLSRATGIPFTAHCLRHTFGSIAIEQQIGLVQLKEIMGHSNIQSTMIYLSMSPEGLKESLNRLELY